MTAIEALESYGYRLIETTYIRYPGGGSVPDLTTERWEETTGGWHCYKVPTLGFGSTAWGRYVRPDLVQVPWRQSAHNEGVSGQHPARQPEAFEWVWPDEVVTLIYEHAGQEGWQRLDDGSMIKVS